MHEGFELRLFLLSLLLTSVAVGYETNDEGYPLGFKLHENYASQAPWRIVKETKELPKRFSWRDHYILPPVKNQGRCGSCVAFGVAGVVESLHRIAFGLFKDEEHSKQTSMINLSEQSMVSRCSSAGDCGGGYLTHFNYAKSNGIPYEKDDPYLGTNSRCKNEAGKVKVQAWGYVGDRGRPSVDQIKQSLYKYGPSAITINGRISYKSGVFTACGSTQQNHVVTLEGWHDDERYKDYGGGYWIVRNSWGAGWGEDGFIRIAYRRKGTDTPCHGVAQVATWAELEGIGPIGDYVGH